MNKNKQIKNIEKSINRANKLRNFKNLHDFSSYEDFLIAVNQEKYFTELNYKNKTGGGAETSTGSYLVKELVNNATDNTIHNLNAIINKRQKSNIDRFFMKKETFLNLEETEVDEKMVKETLAIVCGIMIDAIFKEKDYQLVGDSIEYQSKAIPLYSLYEKVGKAVLREQVVNSFRIQQPDLFKHVNERFIQNNKYYERMSKISKANQDINFIDLDGCDKNGVQILNTEKNNIDNDLIRMGVFFVDNVVNSSNNVFKVTMLSEGVKTKKYISLTEEIEHNSIEVDLYNAIHKPEILPIPVQFGKKKWKTIHDKLFNTLNVDFIKGMNKRQLKAVANDNYLEIIKSANILQNTEFSINHTVYNTIKYLLDNDTRFVNEGGELILPFQVKSLKEEMSKLPAHLEEHKENIKEFYSQVNAFKNKDNKKKLPKRLTKEGQSKKFQKILDEYREHQIKIRHESDFLQANRSKYLSLHEAMDVANMLKNEVFTIPVNIDWRTRYYYMSVLNPQTSDNIKGLLNFGSKERVTEESDIYFMYNCGANDYGLDKKHPDEKNDWVKENIDLIIESGKDPIKNIDFWGNADKPFMFLNFCSEIYQYSLNNFEYIDSSYICYFDGSCNGTQHFAAMTRDINSAKLTNLCNYNERFDLYTEVAKKTEEIVQALADGDLNLEVCGDVLEFEATHIQHAIDILKFGVNRKLVKQNVMTLTYGATDYGRLEQISSVYKGVIQNKGTLPFKQDEIGKKSAVVAKAAKAAIKHLNPNVFSAMRWLEACMDVFDKVSVRCPETNKLLSSGLNPQWSTIAGARLEQRYKKTKSEKVENRINGKRMRFNIETETNEFNLSKNKGGIIPNLVHGNDAAHMTLTINGCYDAGINNFSCVHDSFGVSVKNASKLYQIVRKTFVDMYKERDYLNELYIDFKAQIAEHDSVLADDLPLPPAMGDYDVRESLNSIYSFI